jgi:hypothetical protein
MQVTNHTKNLNLKNLGKCFPDVDSCITKGLAVTTDSKSGNLQGQKQKNKNQILTPCQKLATKCLTGEVPCYAHNFYNYEVYVEDLVLWKECSAKKERNYRERDIRVDVIRSKHSEHDLYHIFKLWTGAPVNTTLRFKRENSAEGKGIEASKYVSAVGIRKLF